VTRRVLDLTRTIEHDMPVFPAYLKPVIRGWTCLELHGFRSNLVMMIEHTGTHVDSPAHFMKEGPSIDELPLDSFHGRAVLLDLSSASVPNKSFKASDIKVATSAVGASVDRAIVLLRTGWEDRWNSDDYWRNPGLSREATAYLLKRRVKAVGIDTPSVDPGDSRDFPAHAMLLRKGVPIYENLTNLKALSKPEFMFAAFPLKIKGGSASPVRAVAVLDRDE
jgi:kynurenine formamidase